MTEPNMYKATEHETKKTSFPPTRVSIAFAMFVTTCVGYLVRTNLSINIVGMVRPPVKNITEDPQILPDYGPRYDWSNAQQSSLLSAFFYGFMGMQMIGGWMNQFFGPRYLGGSGLIISALITALIPLAAEYSYWAVFVLRTITGAMAALILPGVQLLISKWSPPQERGKFVFSQTGGMMGTVFTWPFVAYLMSNYGWAQSFYVPAAIVMIAGVYWFYIVYDTPADHPRIGEQELKFIQVSQGDSVSKTQKSFPPILGVLTSIPFWAVFLLHFGHMWSYYFLLLAAPKYLNEVLKFDLTDSGFLASAPYLCCFLSGFVFGAISDFVIRRNLLSVTNARKFFCIFSHIIPGLLLYCLRYVSDTPINCVYCITLAFTFNGAQTVTNSANRLDIAPNYAGFMYSVQTMFASSTGILAPMVASYFTREQNTVNEWNDIFLVSTVMYIAPAILFMIFGSAEVQSWNDDKRKETNENHC